MAGSLHPRYRGNELRSEVSNARDRGDSVSSARSLRSDVSKKMPGVRGISDPRYRGSTVLGIYSKHKFMVGVLWAEMHYTVVPFYVGV